MARAAGKKPSKQRGKSRADARGQRAARPGAKRARGTPARPRAAAKKRVSRTLATARRTVKAAVAKRAVKKRVARAAGRAERAVKQVTSAVRRRLQTARKRATAARAGLRKRVTKLVKAARPARARKRAVPRAAAKRAVVERTPLPAAFALQRAGATAREELLFELARARASVKAATQGLTAGTAERPLGPGKWSIKEIVLHLSERDRVRLEEFARTLGGARHSWAGMHDPEMRPVNEQHLAPLRAHTWDEALRRLDTLREQLLFQLAQVPAQPDDVWRRGHPFGDMMWGLPDHDRHHAAQIKLARIGAPGPVED